ncbi:MAG: transposase [Hyphomonas sp.]|uniref:IS66-like element accessory protein TnpA n=1 Tax=Hyphomonas sp. TaxID=87 RepID=UPI0034A0235F
MGQVTVFSGPERRRRWTDEERLQIVAEAFAPGARVADACRRHDVSTGLIYTWRRKLREAGERATSVPEAIPTPLFAEAVLAEDAAAAACGAESPAIIIDLPRGKRLSIYPAAPPALVAVALKALR